MRVRRLLTSVLTASLLATTAGVALTASPAAAATPTTITGPDGAPWLQRASSFSDQPGAVVRGDDLALSITVVDPATGERVYDGSLVVERLMRGAAPDAWQPVASSPNAYLYDTVQAVANATYRVTYSGTETHDPSVSSLAVAVQRDLVVTAKNRPLGLAGTIAPRAKLPVVVQKKVNGTWKNVKTVRSDARGRFFAGLPAPEKRGARFYWRLQVKPSTQFATTRSGVYYTTRY